MTLKAPTFVPVNPIEISIKAGDFDGVVGAIRALSAPQRTAAAASLRSLQRSIESAGWSGGDKAALWWGSVSTNEQRDAARAAMFFCGGDAERPDMWPYNNAVFDHLDLLAPASLKRLANDLARKRPSWMHEVQRLVIEGWSDRPDCDEYIMGLMTAGRNNRFGPSPLRSMIDADPGLLDGPVLRLFEVEGNGDMNMASAEKFTFKLEDSWTAVLLELIERGAYTRAQLIDRTLSTLEQDWPQFRAGWFSRFHDKLAPTPDEMTPHRERYAALCHSRIPPTVTLAIVALGALFKHGSVPSALVLEALVPVMSSAVKSQVESALRIADAIVKREPESTSAASALLAPGLAHDSAELQKKIIARMAAWGVAEDGRAAIVRMLPYVAAANRAALALLAGEVVPDFPAPAQDRATPASSRESPVGSSRELGMLEDMAEIVQVVALVLEDDSDTDQFERALDGLARIMPLDPDAIVRFAPVIKRARLRIERPLSAALARLLLYAAGAQQPPARDDSNTVSGELGRRMDDLIGFADRNGRLSALSAPTHRRGFIHPDALVQRAAAHEAAGACSSLEEQVRALLRLAVGDWPVAREQARGLAPSDFSNALRYALGDDVPAGDNRALFVAAARIRHSRDDDHLLMQAYGEMGPDGPAIAHYQWSVSARESHGHTFFEPRFTVSPIAVESGPAFIATRRHDAQHDALRHNSYWDGRESLLLYGASIFPSNLDAFCANGAMEICLNRDWWEARWQDKAYLVMLIDPTVRITPVAARLLACALGGKEAGQAALAVDAFVAATVEGRLDAALLGTYIRELLEAQAGLAARYAKSLAFAARAHRAMPAAVVATLCALVRFEGAKPPKDTGSLLELLLELALGSGLPLPPGAAESIGRLALAGKGKAAQRDILARL